MTPNYYRIRLGEGGRFAAECLREGFIGVHWGFKEDLSGQFGDDWRDFNRRFRPIYLERHPGGTAVAAGLACGMLWTVGQGMKIGDIVLCPDANNDFIVGEVTSDYYAVPDGNLPQRRRVRWFSTKLGRGELSPDLWRSVRGPGTVVSISGYAAELQRMIEGDHAPDIVVTSDVIEDAATFALEKHLEDFLVTNWTQTELGRNYEIYAEEGEQIG